MSTRLLVWGGILAVVSVALVLVDPVVAAFVAILGVCALAVAVLGSSWEQQSTFEERENARARRRAEKWERTKGARERDRARWEAHQARKARKARRPGG